MKPSAKLHFVQTTVTAKRITKKTSASRGRSIEATDKSKFLFDPASSIDYASMNFQKNRPRIVSFGMRRLIDRWQQQ